MPFSSRTRVVVMLGIAQTLAWASSFYLPAVLALRFFIPDGCRIVALVSYHPVVPGRWSAPPTWDAWPS